MQAEEEIVKDGEEEIDLDSPTQRTQSSAREQEAGYVTTTIDNNHYWPELCFVLYIDSVWSGYILLE